MTGIRKKRPGGEKESREHVEYGTKDGQIEFGHIHLASSSGLESDVTAGVYLQAYDSMHYMSMDIDGPREGWTLNRCPGPYEIISASNNAGIVRESVDKTWPGVGYFLLAENGDIIIRAPKGRIRMSALDIDIRADGPDNTRGSINIDSNQSVNVKTGSFDVIASTGVKIFTPKSMNLIANTSMTMVSNFMNGLTSACAKKPSKSSPISQSTERYNDYQSGDYSK
jgi:hypothetical protein